MFTKRYTAFNLNAHVKELAGARNCVTKCCKSVNVCKKELPLKNVTNEQHVMIAFKIS